MTDDGLFEMPPRPPFATGDRIDLHTLWGIQHGIVVQLPIEGDGLVIAIDGVLHVVDSAYCTFTEEDP
jgi:hypothetical protein